MNRDEKREAGPLHARKLCDALEEERELLVGIAVHATEPVASELAVIADELEILRRRAADLETALACRKVQLQRAHRGDPDHLDAA